ncbi:UPF0182 family protein [Nocardioides sp. URHA0032]|uniref:UPF0182 family protein n=1 Tax=Nocardioides sp. URHA0032 TaxID=1380388 RepID=UPI0009DED2FF|nr:UPF0182 family protein [Nocardioides sp. URHA0032]
MRGHLTVDEAARALGTSPQTVRTLLRTSQLQGSKRAWGSRYVWEVSDEGLETFLARYGRLDGVRRRGPVAPAALVLRDERALVPLVPDGEPEPEPEPEEPEEPPDLRPLLLRPRARATAMVVVLGPVLLVTYVVMRTLPDVLWFREVGQSEVFTRTLVARFEFRLLVLVPVALFTGANLAVALRGAPPTYRWVVRIGRLAAPLVIGGMFASAVDGRWQTFVLWRHRQTFGVADPVHGKDVGFFVFSLPFERLVVDLLLWLVVVAAACVAIAYSVRGKLSWRRRRLTLDAQQHLAFLAAAFLLTIAWRLHLQTYLLELQQPSPDDSDSFAGADYVDVHVRMPGLTNLSMLAVVLAFACLAAPLVARRGRRRRARVMVGVPLVLLVAGSMLIALVVPPVVQRFVVDPNPLLREQALVAQSIAGTRAGLGLDGLDARTYAPTHRFTAADFGALSPRLRNVQTWDNDLLGSRMRELVTDTPYFRPEDEALDVVRRDGRRQPTVVSTRELDLAGVPENGGTWENDRLAYTHGSGLIRFSATQTGEDRGPRLLAGGVGLSQPRIYFGDFAPVAGGVQDASWVLADTRRAEVDGHSAATPGGASYHYTGTGGIAMSSWVRRAAFAAALGSKQILLSDDITPESRILLHRDVHDRLDTLAPFIHWDSSAVPLTSDGHIEFVVDGYTTSSYYPFAQRFQIGDAAVSYARASVRATVDAFSGRVRLYLVDPDDPVVRAWAAAYPSLFLPADAMPQDLQDRLRYPTQLFTAQATAYETYHALDPGVFTSDSDAWSRPIALSGPIEVASGVDFDQSDEDDLRLTMQPSYSFSSPPGATEPGLALTTYYVPSQGQNLVATLTGWIDPSGRPRLTATTLPRDPVTLGPAQVSRLVFATPRVRNLLGLRNLEVRDLDKSSIDSVILGRPHLLLLPGGVLQTQSLYEGSRGPGAARLLGVTAYIDGHAGLGPDIVSAVRQALNEPPVVELRRPRDPATVHQSVPISFDVGNAARETVTVTSPAGREQFRRHLANGTGTIRWTPSAAGWAHLKVSVIGLDETVVTDSASVRVLGHPPSVRFLGSPGRAEVGDAVRVPFRILFGHRAVVTVSTRSGIAFERRYDLTDGRGVVSWTPDVPGRATIRIRARGQQDQATTVTLRLLVHEPQGAVAPPPVQLLHVPQHPTVGVAGSYAFGAAGCSTALVEIEGPSDDVPTWRFPCPVGRAEFAWTPALPGHYRLTTSSRAGGGLTSTQTLRIDVAATPDPQPGPTALEDGRAET